MDSGISQWETMLFCNVVSHWLNTYPEWSSRIHVGISILTNVKIQEIIFVAIVLPLTATLLQEMFIFNPLHAEIIWKNLMTLSCRNSQSSPGISWLQCQKASYYLAQSVNTTMVGSLIYEHDDVIKMETFSALLALCAGNSPVTGEFPSKGQWRGALMFSLISAWINSSVNKRE